VSFINRIFGRTGQKKKGPAGGSQQGLGMCNHTQVNTMKQYAIDGTEKKILSKDVGWLQLRLDRGERELFSEPGLLTPELATLLLGRNNNNRPLNETRAQLYARDITEGRWEITGASISISRCGNLNDGQTRCRAVQIAQKPIQVFFTFGLSFESRLNEDTGAIKTAGDFLGMEGVASGGKVAAVAKGVLEYEKHGKLTSTASEAPTKSEVRIRASEDEFIAVSAAVHHKSGASKVAGPTVIGLAHYVFAQRDRQAADEFMHRLISGENLAARNPILVAREKLIDPYRRLTKNEQLKCIFMAWNNWRANKTVRSLTHTIKKGEKLPEVR
jgi:hypothetical protein